MIISHKHRFIFIKTRKTAGTSIEVYLSQYCGQDDVLTPVLPPVEGHVPRNHEGRWNPAREIAARGITSAPSALRRAWRGRRFFNHIPATSVRYRVPKEIWEGYFKFCVERNPWDKALSHFHMLRTRQNGALTFDEYLSSPDLCLNYPLYTDHDGKLLVDRVLRYENLNEEIGSVFRQLGVPFGGSLDVRAKAEYRKDRADYRDVYTPAQRAAVQKAFQFEIDLHGYTF